MNVLLTGSKGNFGKALTQLSDDKIIGLDRGDWPLLHDRLAVGIDVVVHAAWDLRVQASSSPTTLIDSNLMTTGKLLEAMKAYHTPRLIYLSSCAVYGEGMSTDEKHNCNPISLNGVSKLLNERLIEAFCSENGIKFEIYRIFNVYGGNDRFSVISHLRYAIDTSTPFNLNNQGLAQRDFIHVNDMAAIINHLLRIDVPFTHVNVGTGVATKISTLLSLVLERFPKLEVARYQSREAEYSRAEIGKLQSLIDWNFIRIEDYLRNEFMK